MGVFEKLANIQNISNSCYKASESIDIYIYINYIYIYISVFNDYRLDKSL